MKPLLTIDHFSKVYHTRTGETLALQDIHLHIHEGEFVCLVGPSGCGKSTLLTAIAGLDSCYTGTITTAHPLPVGYMFQRDELLEWRTVLDNACLGLEIQKQRTPDTEAYVQSLLTRYGLSDFQNRYPSELSGGMRQRVALIRTLALKPRLFLLDEPFSALDYETRLAVSDEIWTLFRQSGMTAIMVTHDIPEAISLGDRVIVLSSRPGHIVKDLPIRWECEQNPLSARQNPLFQKYFQEIWEVMKHAES